MEHYGIEHGELSFHMLTAACGEAADATVANSLVSKLKEGRLSYRASAVDCGQLVKELLATPRGMSSGSACVPTSISRLAAALSVLDWMDEQSALRDAPLCLRR